MKSLIIISLLLSIQTEASLLKAKPEAVSAKQNGIKSNVDFVNQLESLKPQKKSATALLFSTTPLYHDDVYCSRYSDSNTYGYSLYRYSDRRDIANAVWSSSERYECQDAAEVSNQTGEGITCARFFNKNSNSTAYSIYRIFDNQDLGYATISDFYQCQDVVKYARRGVFCSTYIVNGTLRWSMYDVSTGRDIGSMHYASFERCLQEYW